MSYSTPQDVKDRVQNLSSRVTDDLISRFIDEADAIIDSRLNGVYVIPFDPVPTIIKRISAELATCLVNNALMTSQQPNFDGYQETRYQEVMKMLDMLANGDMIIPDIPTVSNSSGFASTNSDEPLFTRTDPFW